MKIWFYFIIMLLLVIVGFAIGSANDSLIVFDFLIVKSEISVATVLVIGVLFGLLLGIYVSLLLCLKLWLKNKITLRTLNKYKKQIDTNQTNKA